MNWRFWRRPKPKPKRDECQDLWELAILFYVFIMCLFDLWRKPVETVPVVTVVVEAPAYSHGDTVKVTGTVMIDGVAQVGTSVAVSLTDSAGVGTDLGTVATDASGAYTVSAPVPVDMAAGATTVTASALSITVTTTFIRHRQKISH